MLKKQDGYNTSYSRRKIWNNCEDFRNFWIGLWKNVQAAFSVAWEAILNFFTVTIPEIGIPHEQIYQGYLKDYSKSTKT